MKWRKKGCKTGSAIFFLKNIFIKKAKKFQNRVPLVQIFTTPKDLKHKIWGESEIRMNKWKETHRGEGGYNLAPYKLFLTNFSIKLNPKKGTPDTYSYEFLILNDHPFPLRGFQCCPSKMSCSVLVDRSFQISN